jgi:hypothetical protein
VRCLEVMMGDGMQQAPLKGAGVCSGCGGGGNPGCRCETHFGGAVAGLVDSTSMPSLDLMASGSPFGGRS